MSSPFRPQPPKKGAPVRANEIGATIRKAWRTIRGGPGILVKDTGDALTISLARRQGGGGGGGVYRPPFWATCELDGFNLNFAIRSNSYFFANAAGTPGEPFQEYLLTSPNDTDARSLVTAATTTYFLYLQFGPDFDYADGDQIDGLIGGLVTPPTNVADAAQYARLSTDGGSGASPRIKAITSADTPDTYPWHNLLIATFSVTEDGGDASIVKTSQVLECNPIIQYPLVGPSEEPPEEP
jgi:hypothetical protein